MRGVLLISDGIDSPVAGHMMLKQGMELIFLNFMNDRSNKKVKRLTQKLDKNAPLVTVDHRKFQELVRSRCNTRYQCVLCKRRMYRVAEGVAEEHNADYLVTGENLGQVASQTLDNMYVLDKAVKMPVLRPLLGFDKNETMKIAREIGTYDISILKSSPCRYVPRNPITMASLNKTQEEEEKIGHC